MDIIMVAKAALYGFVFIACRTLLSLSLTLFFYFLGHIWYFIVFLSNFYDAIANE